jgi:PAS domain S-box-containing protein
MQFVQSLLVVPSGGREDARRRRLLNILIAGSIVLTIAVSILTGVAVLLGEAGKPQEYSSIFISAAIVAVGAAAVYGINRYVSGWLASALFLILLTVVLSFSDDPEQVAGGRSLFVYTLPIIMASVLLRPSASFIFAILSSLVVSIIAVMVGIVPNIPAVMGFFLIALVSWLSSRSLEQALGELDAINRELDQRVQERTLELSQALARETAEASRNQAILEGIADGVVVFDVTGKAIVANPSIGRLVGRRQAQIIGSTIPNFSQDGDLKEPERQALTSMLEEPEKHLANLRLKWGRRSLSVNAAPVQGAGGEMIAKVAVFRDVTRETEIEEMKNAFVAMVSHELRTPLNAVLGYAEMLREAIFGPLNDKQVNATARILTNTRRLLDIVNDLLDQAQIEAGKLTIRPKPFSPNELLDGMHAVMDKIVHDRSLQLSSVVARDMPLTLTGDVQRLQQVLVNLVNNAVKFTDRGGIYVRFYLFDPQHWAMQVSDTGKGIPMESQKTIFDAFQQVDATTTRQHGGIGLGLAIVKRLVELMGGEIQLVSQVGTGSTFTVILPLAPVETPKEGVR